MGVAKINRSGGTRLVGLVVAALVAVAACSSSSHSKSTSGSQGTGSGPAPTGTPFKIGYIEDAVSLGAGGNNPYTIPVFQAWVKWINANGGINGHPVQVLVKREPNNPGVAQTDVQDLVNQGIVTLIEDDVSDTAGWLPIVDKAGIPILSGADPSLQTQGDSLNFSILPALVYTPEAVVESALQAGSHTVAAFYCAEIAACAQAVPALSAVGKKIGVSVAFGTSILGSSPGYTAQCLAAKEHHATSVWVADASQIILRVAASCAQQGYTPPELTSTSNIQQNMAGAPGMEGMVGFDGVAPFFDTSVPGVQTMRAALQQYDPSLINDPQWGDLSTVNWVDGLLISAAAKAGNVGTTSPLTAAAMLNGIYTLHTTDLGGMTPTLTFVPGGSHLQKCWFWIGIQNGKFTLPNGLTPKCIP
jgi:branched-chain amino acid transport system substrate-binding protein